MIVDLCRYQQFDNPASHVIIKESFRFEVLLNLFLSTLRNSQYSDMPPSHRARATLALKFIVVGGGISGPSTIKLVILNWVNAEYIWYGILGIATAYTLQKAGHHVLLLESSDGRSRVGAHPFGVV